MVTASPESAPFREPRTSGAAVTSLVFGIIGALGGCVICGIPPLVAIITGHIGVARTRGGQLRGHGTALAGLILGYLLVLPTVAVLALVAFRPATAAEIVKSFTDFFTNLAG